MDNNHLFVEDIWEVEKYMVDMSLDSYRLNVILSRKDKSVMGFGSNFDVAFENGKNKLVKLLRKLEGDCIEIHNSVPMRNGANFQYNISASLYTIKK